MKTGLVFNSIQNVAINNQNSIILKEKVNDDDRVNVEDAIYIRYKFDTYTTEVLRFIKDMKSKFKHSIHICDLVVNHELFEENYSNIKEYLDNIALIGRLEMTDDMLVDIDTSLDGLDKTKLKRLDKLVITDNTSKMNFQEVKAIQQMLYNKYSLTKTGLCNSPFTNKDNCCISPLFARELGSVYGDEKTAVAVASHSIENTNGCSCVRYLHINYDIEYVELNKRGKVSVNSTSENKKVKKSESSKSIKSEKKEKKPVIKNSPLVDFWD